MRLNKQTILWTQFSVLTHKALYAFVMTVYIMRVSVVWNKFEAQAARRGQRRNTSYLKPVPPLTPMGTPIPQIHQGQGGPGPSTLGQ